MRPVGRILGALAVCAPLVLTGCGGPSAPSGQAVSIVVSAPISSEPWVGSFTRNGAALAVEQVNRAGGVTIGGKRRPLRLDVRDNQGSPQQAVAIARAAVAEHALAIVTDGTGSPAVARITDPAHLPVFVTDDGGDSLVDATAMPTIFRVAPADKYLCRRLADYIADRKPKVALLTEDSSFGADGRADLRKDLAVDEVEVVDDVQLPAQSADVSPQVAQARARGADTLVLWLRGTGIASVIRAARQSGWTPAVFTGPDGENPVVRQQLADHPGWTDGLTFVAGRITSETGPGPFTAFRAAYEKRFGRDVVVPGVVSPPDYAMYAADAVTLVAAAATAANALGPALMAAMGTTVVTGANGDERGFLPTGREGVVPGDMYLATFHDQRFTPVTDDIVGPQHLPTVPQ